MNSRGDASIQLGAKEYHSKTGIAAAQRKIESDFKARFVNLKSGKVGAEFVKRRSCPVCQGGGGEVAFTKNGFDHVRCECSMVYVPDVLRDEYLNLVYSSKEHEADTHDSFRTEPRKTFITEIYKEGMALIEKAGGGSGILLDVGCSSGLFLEYAASRGYTAEGVEPSEYAVNLGRERGLSISQGYFTASSVGDKRYDLITLWDVLEHCEDPDIILKDAHRALSNCGLLFLQVPNVMGLAPRIMREHCNMFNGYGHINLFGPGTIKRILEECGFRDVLMQTVISEISVINNYLDYCDPYLGPSTERNCVFNSLDVQFIHQNLLGYKLQVTARK